MLREELKVSVSECRVLRRIFEPNRDEVTGGWRKVLNEELHNLYSSPSIIRLIKSRRMRWVGHAGQMEETMNAYRILVGKPEGKRPLGKCIHRCEDNIKMDLKEMRWGVVNSIDLTQNRGQWMVLVTLTMTLQVL
jgi:hypothetical protein